MYAGGLRHYSAGPLASAMYADGSLEPMAIDQLTSFRAGMLFCETEGILPAPECAHAVAGMMDVVSRHPRREAPLIVLVNISGHGLLDLGACSRFAAGEIEPVKVDEASLSQSLGALEEFNQRIARNLRKQLTTPRPEGRGFRLSPAGVPVSQPIAPGRTRSV